MYLRLFGKSGCADHMSLQSSNEELAVVCDLSRSGILTQTESLGTTAPSRSSFYTLYHASVYLSLL